MDARFAGVMLVSVMVAVCAGTAGSVVFATESTPLTPLDAHIEIVWPHAGGLPGTEVANVTVALFERQTLHPFCDRTAGVNLFTTSNDEATTLEGFHAVPRAVTLNGITFFVWDFNDLDLSSVSGPEGRLYLSVYNSIADFKRAAALPGGRVPDYIPVESEVWVHGAAPLVPSPEPIEPTVIAPTPRPGSVPYLEPRIQVVWPHDAAGTSAPIESADLANVTAAIVLPGSTASVGPEFNEPVNLYAAQNREPLRQVAVGHKRLVTTANVVYPVWDFDNVDVSAARDPANHYVFQVHVDGSYGSNVWTYGSADTRTVAPELITPDRSCSI